MSGLSSLGVPIVGPQSKTDGSYLGNPRGTRTGGYAFAAEHGEYFEMAHRGTMFAACVAAGAAPGTTISTTACAVLYNPAGSGKRLAIYQVRQAYVSGTLGTGTMFHCINGTATQTAPSGGTAATVVNMAGGNAGAAVGVFRAGATVVAGTVFAPFCTLAPILATSVVHPTLTWEDLRGGVVLEPGTSYQLQSVAAAGTAPLVSVGISWDEVSIPS